MILQEHAQTANAQWLATVADETTIESLSSHDGKMIIHHASTRARAEAACGMCSLILQLLTLHMSRVQGHSAPTWMRLERDMRARHESVCLQPHGYGRGASAQGECAARSHRRRLVAGADAPTATRVLPKWEAHPFRG